MPYNWLFHKVSICMSAIPFTSLFESSISRVWEATKKFDVAMMSAWRSAMIDCVDEEKCTGAKPTKAEKDKNNEDLRRALLQRMYGVTRIQGGFVEGYGGKDAREVCENSFFIVNLNNDVSFFKVLEGLGRYYCQDSIFCKPLGETPYLLGTNNAPFPSLGNKSYLPNLKVGWEVEPTEENPGKARTEFYSKVGGRPFGWQESLIQRSQHSFVGRRFIAIDGTRVLKEAGVYDLPFGHETL